MYQNTTKVTKTSQLSNEFIMRTALGFNSKNSTMDTKRYEGVVGLLSIKDYNNETSIDLCIR
jgi:hypothetical protein